MINRNKEREVKSNEIMENYCQINNKQNFGKSYLA